MNNHLQTTLLIGNGLNQCLKGGVPWGNLLERIGNKLKVEVNENIPLPLEFERLINVHLEENPSDAKEIYTRVKKMIAEIVAEVSLPQTAIHNKLRELSLDGIITTNYDLLLEHVYSSSFFQSIHSGGAGNPKYLLGSVGTVEGVDFYHAHGCISKPTTLCLGYEHYMGSVEKIRSEMKKGANKKGKGHILAVLEGSEESNNTWIERFYTSNLGILGLGLYECEADLWWLLTHRASLYYSDPSGAHSYIRNTISYYDVIDDLPKASVEAEIANIKKKEAEKKHALLKGMNVNVKKFFLSNTQSGTYQEAYEKIFNHIKENGI